MSPDRQLTTHLGVTISVATAPLSTPTRSARARDIVLLGGLTALPALAIDAYLPALPSLARDLHTTQAAAQLTVAALLVGLALGQLVTGPVSDRLGRRVPLLVGLTVFTISSALCSAAPTIGALVALRLLEGLAGGACVVVTRAVVRDQTDGVETAAMFARLMLVMGVAPIVAPVAGAQLLRVTSWRGVFVAVAVIGVALFAFAWRRLGETHLPDDRSGNTLRQTLGVFGVLLRDRTFTGYAACSATVGGGMFAYISASPFVLQKIYGLSAAAFSGVFALNAAGLIGLSQLSAYLVRRTGPRRLLLAGVSMSVVGGLGLLAAVLTSAPLPVLLVALFLVVASVGLVGPNATALALAAHGHQAGSAAALLGLLQFAVGAVAGPLTGLGGDDTAVPLGLVATALAVCATTSAFVARRR